MNITLKLLILQVFFTPTAFAYICESESLVLDVLKQAKIQPKESALIDCKSDSMDESNVIMAYAQSQTDQGDGTSGHYLLNIIKYNRGNVRLNYHYKVAEELVSDAISLNSIQLDTANYKISNSNRALGIRLNYSGHSQPNPFSMTVLNLYDLKNKKTVLDSFIVTRYRAETDTRCNAEVEDRASTLSMQNIQSNQFFDILVKSRIDRSIFQGTRENCQEMTKPTTLEKFTLKFDGQQYQIPQAFKQEYRY